MGKNKRIEVVSYRSHWAERFASFCKRYTDLLGDLILTVEHVGSTAVPGLWAKPIIDIDIVVKSFDALETIAAKLSSIGYKHRGNLGVPLREAFSYQGPDDLPGHHLYVCQEGCDSLRNHLTVRDYLLSHGGARNSYSTLKRDLAERYPYDIDSYIAGKTPFLVDLLRKCDFDESALNEITVINEKP